MSDCKLRLDNLQDQYYPGDTVRGKVIYSVGNPHNVDEVGVRLEGAEDVRVRIHHSDEPTIVEFRGNNTLLELERRWPVQGDLKPGEYEYPFEFQLPKNLPETYMSKYGCIEYTIKARASGLITFNESPTKKVKLIAPIDFNQVQGLKLEPVDISENKAVCSLFFCKGFYSMDVQLDKQAFVLGETVKVDVKIINKGDFNILRVNAKIHMIVKVACSYPCHKIFRDSVMLTEAYSDQQVNTGNERSYRFFLQLPKTAIVPNLAHSKLFSQEFLLEVTGYWPTCTSNITAATNILVGHIPIGGQQLNEESRDHPSALLRLPGGSTHSSGQEKHNPPPIGYITSFQSGIPQPYPPPHAGGNLAPYPLEDPSGHSVAPYPVGPSTSTNSSSPAFPMPPQKLPPKCDSIGFAVPTSITSSSESPHIAVPFVPVPLPTHAPYPPTHAPTAPSMADDAADHDLAVVGPTSPLLEGRSEIREIAPPPSYEEAMASSLTSPLKKK